MKRQSVPRPKLDGVPLNLDCGPLVKKLVFFVPSFILRLVHIVYAEIF